MCKIKYFFERKKNNIWEHIYMVQYITLQRYYIFLHVSLNLSGGLSFDWSNVGEKNYISETIKLRVQFVSIKAATLDAFVSHKILKKET